MHEQEQVARLLSILEHGPVDDLGSGITVELWAAPPAAPGRQASTAGHSAPGR